MRLFEEQNLPSRGRNCPEQQGKFVFLSKNFGYEGTFLEFNRAKTAVVLYAEEHSAQVFEYRC